MNGSRRAVLASQALTRKPDPDQAWREQGALSPPSGEHTAPVRRPHVCRASGKQAVETSRQISPEALDKEEAIDWVIVSQLFLFPALCGLLFGYDIGGTSGALVSLQASATSGTEWGPSLTSLQTGVEVSSSLAGALAGSVATFVLGDRIGRKAELKLAAALYGSAALMMASAPSLPVLVAGHSLYGIGIGFAMHAAPAYIAETAPPSVRGLLISLKEGFIVGGILLGYLAGSVFVETEGGWRYILGCAAPIALVAGLGLLTLPESPRWSLLSQTPSAVKDAEQALARMLGSKATEERVAQEVMSIQQSLVKLGGKVQEDGLPVQKSAGEKLQGILGNPAYTQPLLIGTSLMLFQQITGQPSVLYYAAKIFKDAGFSAASDAANVSVLLGVFKLIMTGVATVKVDSWGRRPLLLAGVSGMVASLCILAGASLVDTGGTSAYASVGALLLYVGCYQLSFGPISWLIVGEVFPLSVRGQALSLATITNFGANFVVSLVLPYAEESLGLGRLYLVFAVIGAVAVTFIYQNVPETRGKSLEEIEAIWGNSEQE